MHGSMVWQYPLIAKPGMAWDNMIAVGAPRKAAVDPAFGLDPFGTALPI